MILKRLQPGWVDDHRRYPIRTVLPKHHVIEAAEGCRNLVLRSHRLANDALLYVNRLTREIFLGDVAALQCPQGVDQPDGERRARAQPGPCRQIAVVMDL